MVWHELDTADLPSLTLVSQFPGYTSENLASRGVHEVSQRRFVLVAADHPIVVGLRFEHLPTTVALYSHDL